MKKILVLLGLVACCFFIKGQRSYQFESSDRLFIEGKEFFEIRNYPGCVDKLNCYKQKATNKDLIQEADFMLAFIAFEQGSSETAVILEGYLEKYPDTRHRNEICFLLGSAFFAQKNYDRAQYWFTESDMNRLSPNQQEEYAFRLAYSWLQIGDLEKAQSYFNQIRQVGVNYREAASYYSSYIDYATENYDRALDGFNLLKNNSIYTEKSLYYITQIHFIQKRYDKVISSGEELLATYPESNDNIEIFRILGNAFYHQGNQAKALDMLSNYVDATDTPLRNDLYLLGVCYYNNGDYQKAIESFAPTVIIEDELSQNAYLYLGQSYLKLGDKNNARMAFEQAATTTFDSQIQEAAMFNYALLIHETSFSGFGESVTIFEDFLNSFPNSKYTDKVNDYLIEVYLTTKNYESALKSIDKIRKPGAKILAAKQNALFQLGAQAFTDQQSEKAIEYFNEAINLGEYDKEAFSDAYFWRGEAHYKMNNYSKAAFDYQAFLNKTNRRDDMSALAYYNLGYCRFKQKNYNDALSAFRQYVNLEKKSDAPSLADAYNRIGDCQFYNRQFTAAEESYTKASSLQPSSSDYAIYQKGVVLGLQKDYQGKIALMDRLIRDFPESPYLVNALYEKGRTYVLLETYNMAASAFNKLIEEYPQSSLAPKSALQLGLLYFNSNQLDKAIESYKKVISDYPGSVEAKVALQDLKSVYVELNDVDSYASYVNSLGGNVRFEVSEQDSLTYFAAEKMFLRGDNEGALKSLRNYLSKFPNGAFSSNANYYLGQLAFIEKNYSDAKRYFNFVIQSGDTKFLEESVARKAEIEYLEKDYKQALKSFKQLISIAQSNENREAGRLGLMRSALHVGQHNDVIQAANELLTNPKLAPEVEAEARLLRAKSYLATNEKSKAETDLQILSKDVRTVYGAEAKYLLAQYYFDKKEISKAENLVMDFIEQGTSHQYWLARGFILLADIYIHKGDDFQARQYLTNLQKNYKGKDDIASMIDDRLSKLK